MSDFTTLSCPSCGGKLQITKDIERFSCAHCGTEHLVKRGGGIVHLAPVLEQVSKGVDNTASELAIARLDKEIGAVQSQISAQNAGLDKLEAKSINPILYLFFGAMFLVWAVISFITGSYEMGACVLLPGVIFIALGLSKSIRVEKERVQNELQQLKNQLSKLEDDRQYHLDKVARK